MEHKLGASFGGVANFEFFEDDEDISSRINLIDI